MKELDVVFAKITDTDDCNYKGIILQAIFRDVCILTDIYISEEEGYADDYIDETGELYVCERRIYVQSAMTTEVCNEVGLTTGGEGTPSEVDALFPCDDATIRTWDDNK